MLPLLSESTWHGSTIVTQPELTQERRRGRESHHHWDDFFECVAKVTHVHHAVAVDSTIGVAQDLDYFVSESVACEGDSPPAAEVGGSFVLSSAGSSFRHKAAVRCCSACNTCVRATCRCSRQWYLSLLL